MTVNKKSIFIMLLLGVWAAVKVAADIFFMALASDDDKTSEDSYVSPDDHYAKLQGYRDEWDHGVNGDGVNIYSED